MDTYALMMYVWTMNYSVWWMYFSQSVTDWLSDRTDYRDAIASKNSELWTDRIYIFTQEIELKVTWYLHID